jgi:hypothetical protein
LGVKIVSRSECPKADEQKQVESQNKSQMLPVTTSCEQPADGKTNNQKAHRHDNKPPALAELSAQKQSARYKPNDKEQNGVP